MIRNVVYTVGSRIITTLMAIAATSITARALGVDGRGQYFYVVTLALLAVQCANFGLSSSNTYLAAKDRELVGRLLSNSLWASLVGGPVAAAVVILLTLLYPGESAVPASELIWAVLIAPFNLAYMLVSNVLVGIQEFRKYNGMVVGLAALQVVLLIAVALRAPSVNAFLSVSLVTNIVSCLLVVSVVSKAARVRVFVAPHIPLFRNSLSFASRAFVVLLLGYLLSRIPALVLGMRGDARALGLTSVVLQFTAALAIIPASIATVLFPKLSQADPKRHGGYVVRLTCQVALLMGLLCLFLVYFGPVAISVLFGESFLAAEQPLLWALPGVVALSAVNVLGQYLAASGFPLSSVLAWGVAVAVGATLSSVKILPDPASSAMATLSGSYLVLAVAIFGAYVLERRRQFLRVA